MSTKIIEKISQNVTIKLMVMGFLSLALLIPLFMVRSMIDERQSYQEGAVSEISQKWGAAQTVSSPMLVVKTRKTHTNSKGKTSVEIIRNQFLAETAQIEGFVKTETRYRGIYEVIVYSAHLKISGHFKNPRLAGDYSILSGISDFRGLKEAVDFKWNGHSTRMHGTTDKTDLFKSALWTPVEKCGEKGCVFEFEIQLKGTGSLQFLPLAKKTAVSLKSNWSNPAFSGYYLPDTREIASSGFNANWAVADFGDTFSEMAKADSRAILENSFGVDFIFPVNVYQKSTRAVKYGFLIIVLTFVMFFLFEVLYSLRIHFLQYLLVGFALSLFFLLLIALSEHVAFTIAYCLAAASTIFLIAGYCSAILGEKKRSRILAYFLAALYASLYVLLQNQDYSLLLGSLLLLLVLATLMYLTRHLDWHTAMQRQK